MRVAGDALLVLSALVLLLLAGCRSPPRPDVVLITLDTTRADHLGCYGYAKDTTPNLDRFAERAVLYERAYSTICNTRPSHASLFTGLLPRQHGVGPAATLKPGDIQGLDKAFTTLAEVFAAAGYRTAGIISGPPLSSEFGFSQGFETYYDEPPGRGKLPWGMNGRRAQQTADLAISRIEQFGASPYFLFVHFWDPHDPYRPPPPFDRDLPPEVIQISPDTMEVYRERIAAGETGTWATSLGPEERQVLAGRRAAYDAEITYMDHHVGRLLDAIAASPRADATMVVVTGDHGESLGEHYYFGHTLNLYEPCVGVPLLVRFPGQQTGRRSARPVQNHWAFTSILGAVGLGLPPEVEPNDLEAGNGVIFTETRYDRKLNAAWMGSFFDRDLYAIYVSPYKLIESSTGTRELYDLDRDPGETVNLAPQEPLLARALSERLQTVKAGHPLLHADAPAARMRPETEDALRALGYIQ